MASIPSNGYNEVMSGTNNYTGTNSFDASCPKTPVVPVAANDLCNKLYVDTIAGGGTVVAVSAGTNISVTGTVPNPVVNLQNPLTAELNVGTQSIRDRTGAVGTNGQVLTAGTGGQVLWGAGGGGGTVTSVSAGTNISITGTATDPIVNLLSPLTSPLSLGSQNISGTTGNLSFVAAPSQAQVAASTGFSATDTTTPAIVCNLTKTGLTCQTAADSTSVSSGGITKTVGTNPLTISTTSSAPITISPVAGLDCNVVVSAGGALTASQASAGGQSNPLCRLTNTNATGSVAMEVYKNKPTAVAAGDVLHNLSVYGKDSSGAKQEYTRITHTIRDGASGTEDGSIEMACFVNGAVSTFLQLNGVENEVNCLKNIDMGGNAIRTTSGDMTITTTPSGGTGALTINSKQNIAMAAVSGQVGITASAGIGLIATTGGIQATAQTGGINLTANGGGTISASTTGAAAFVANTQMSLTSTTGVINIANELHYGKMTTQYSNQVYTPLYQPVLTSSTSTIPVAEIQVEGQQVSLINSRGDGANELTTIPTPNFTITSMIYLPSIASYLAGGYNQINDRAEIRCGTSVNNILNPISSGTFTYIAFPVSGNYINVVYHSTLIPNYVAVGGLFGATTGDTYNGASFFPSDVANFLVIDVTTSTIVPTNMNDGLLGYGVNAEVKTINAQDNTYYTPATAPIYILGGVFTTIVGGTGIPAQNTAVYTPTGQIVPFNSRWNSFIDANSTVNIIYVLTDRIVFGGLFTTIGGIPNQYLAFSDSTLPFPQTSYINGFIPPQPVSAGIEVYNPSYTSYLAYFGTYDTGGTPAYPVYEFDMANMGVTPSLYESSLTAVPLGFGCDTSVSPAKLNYIYGHNSGSNTYLYDVLTPQFIDLNGATRIEGYTSFDLSTAPITPLFFRQPSLTNQSPLEIYSYSVSGAGAVAITTTTAYHFINSAAPTNKYLTLTLANYNNFAIGTVVRFGTDDTGILIYAQNGASFSNPV